MAEQPVPQPNNENMPIVLDVDSEMDGPGGLAGSVAVQEASFPATPNIEAFLENLVRVRLADLEAQTIAQVKAWKEQEIAMRAREQQLLEDIKTLKDRVQQAEEVAASRVSLTTPADRDSKSIPIIPSKRRKTTQGPVIPVLNDNRNRRITRSTSRGTVTGTAATTPGNPPPVAAAAATGGRRPVLAPAAPTGQQLQPPAVIHSQPRSTRVTRASSRYNIDRAADMDNGTSKAAAFGAYPFTFSPAKDAKKKKKKKKNVVKAAAELYRYLPQDMPDDMGGLNKAMALHIRILWGLTDAKEVPKNPPAKVLTNFHDKFSSEEELYACQASGEELIPRRLVQIGNAMSTRTGRISSQASLLEEHMLQYIQVCLSRFGLPCWCPDLRLSAYSLYNAALRIVALDTFKQALVSHAYAHLSPNTKYASNTRILVLLFDHFVFHYLKGRYQKNDRNPGVIAQQLQKSPQYMARIRLASARRKFLEENNYPQRYRDLISTKATSDDERDASQKVWIVKRRPERSAKAEKFIRLLDEKRREVALQRGPRYWKERKRVVPNPDVQQDSEFYGLPDHMPVDYFDPAYFNKLQPKTRNRIAVAQASLLPDVDQSFSWNADERLLDKDFTRKYGAALFVQYEMVSDADMVADEEDGADEWAGIPDEDAMAQEADGEEADGEDLDINTLTSFRETLSSHLSQRDYSSHASSQIILSNSGATRSESTEGSMESIHRQ